MTTTIVTTSGQEPVGTRKRAAKTEKAVKAAPKGGKSRGKRKLTDAQVLEIVARAGNNEKPSVLAREYGVSHPSISAILKGRTYVWLTGIGMPAAPAIEIVEDAEMEAA